MPASKPSNTSRNSDRRRLAGPGRLALPLIVLLGFQIFAVPAAAQDIEPRRWTHLPTGATYVGLGYRYTSADIFTDPTLDLEDVESEQQDLVLSAIHAFSWWNKPIRLEFLLPYGAARWEGLLSGAPASTRRRGFRDSSMRLSMNLFGAPALKLPDYLRWQAENPVRTTFGVAALISAPTGEYQEERLLNLGNNRWVLRPQAGILHTRYDWQFELTASLSLYGDNDEFRETLTQESDSLWFFQGHLIHTFRPGLWASVSWGLTDGGENEIDGIDRGDERRETYWSVSLGLPINRQQGVKLSWIRGETERSVGADSDTFLLGWSVMLAP